MFSTLFNQFTSSPAPEKRVIKETKSSDLYASGRTISDNSDGDAPVRPMTYNPNTYLLTEEIGASRKVPTPKASYGRVPNRGSVLSEKMQDGRGNSSHNLSERNKQLSQVQAVTLCELQKVLNLLSKQSNGERRINYGVNGSYPTTTEDLEEQKDIVEVPDE